MNDILKACIYKKSMTKKQADSCIDYFAEKGKLMFYYKCSFCNSYHATKNIYAKTSLIEVSPNVFERVDSMEDERIINYLADLVYFARIS